MRRRDILKAAALAGAPLLAAGKPVTAAPKEGDYGAAAPGQEFEIGGFRLLMRYDDVARYSVLRREEEDRDVPFDKAERITWTGDPDRCELWLVRAPWGVVVKPDPGWQRAISYSCPDCRWRGGVWSDGDVGGLRPQRRCPRCGSYQLEAKQ